MTNKIYLTILIMGFVLYGVTGNHTLTQNNCDNSIRIRVKQDISFNLDNCTMIAFPELSPAVNCLQITQDLGADGVAVESRGFTHWCCVFFGGQVRNLPPILPPSSSIPRGVRGWWSRVGSRGLTNWCSVFFNGQVRNLPKLHYTTLQYTTLH